MSGAPTLEQHLYAGAAKEFAAQLRGRRLVFSRDDIYAGPYELCFACTVEAGSKMRLWMENPSNPRKETNFRHFDGARVECGPQWVQMTVNNNRTVPPRIGLFLVRSLLEVSLGSTASLVPPRLAGPAVSLLLGWREQLRLSEGHHPVELVGTD